MKQLFVPMKQLSFVLSKLIMFSTKRVLFLLCFHLRTVVFHFLNICQFDFPTFIWKSVLLLFLFQHIGLPFSFLSDFIWKRFPILCLCFRIFLAFRCFRMVLAFGCFRMVGMVCFGNSEHFEQFGTRCLFPL